MATLTPRHLCGVASVIVLLIAGEASASRNDRAALVLHVDNYARIPPSLLAQAQKEAERIYAAAGVRTVWINDKYDTSRPGNMRQLRVLLLCPEMSARKISSDQVAANVLGQAAASTGRAYIFVQRVLAVAARLDEDGHRVLGRVIAHEVGHLLLPHAGHGRKGIMRPGLDLRSRASDKFTAAERTGIRFALKRSPTEGELPNAGNRAQ